MARTLNREALPARILLHLVESGPTEREPLDALADGQCRTAMSCALKRLADAGFIKTKVWLTPEGLAECRRLGWKPELVGVAEPEAAAA